MRHFVLAFAAVAAAAAVPALPALAQTGVAATHNDAHGATAGRSPHRAFRPIARAEGCARPAMHSLPGGKLPVYGTPVASAACGADRLAAADAPADRARD